MIIPFNLQNYFKDVGFGWRINTITGSIFYKDEEIILSGDVVRGVFSALLRKKKKFLPVKFLRNNFLGVDMERRGLNSAAVWAFQISKVINKILNRYGFEIQISGKSTSKNTEWDLCRVN